MIAVEVWGCEWSGKRVLAHCYNKAVENILVSGPSRDCRIMALGRRLFMPAALGSFTIRAAHIPGTDNDIADALSPGQVTLFLRVAPAASTVAAAIAAISTP